MADWHRSWILIHYVKEDVGMTLSTNLLLTIVTLSSHQLDQLPSVEYCPSIVKQLGEVEAFQFFCSR